MKTKTLAIGSALCFFATLAQSEEFHRCESKLFSQMKLLSKVSVALPKAEPTGDLARLVHQYEMICPWQVERDFNNDKKRDWVGFVYRDQNYQLIAYLSGNQRYTLHQLETYAKFPKYSFLKSINAKEVLQRSKNKELLKGARYSLVVHDLKSGANENSSAYTWNGKQLAKSFEYQADFKLLPEKKIETDIDDD